MVRQLTVRLPDDLAEQLDSAARRLERNRSEVVRLALQHYLAFQPDVRPFDRMRDLTGSIESGVPDLGQRHREYLLQRLRSAR